MVEVDEEERMDNRGEQAFLSASRHSDTYVNENDVGVVMELDAIHGVMTFFSDMCSFQTRKFLQMYTSSGEYLRRWRRGKLDNEPRVEVGQNHSNELEETCIA